MSLALSLAMLQDERQVRQMLSSAGLRAAAAAEKSALFRDCARLLLRQGRGEDESAAAFFVPGRIEVLGKHTDYAGGRSLLAAVEKGFCFVASPRRDSLIRMFDAVHRDNIVFPLQSRLTITQGHWSNYPMTVAQRLCRDFPAELVGGDIAFASDLPPAAGMSSSSALVVAAFLVLADINHLSEHDVYRRNITSREDLAAYLSAVENGRSFGSLSAGRGVGTLGGSEDHTALLCCRPGALCQYSFCPTRFERLITLPRDYIFAVAASGVLAEKTALALEKYNRVSRLAGFIAEEWRRRTGRDDPHLAAALASSPQAAEQIRLFLRDYSGDHFSAKDLCDRFEQFYAESTEIIPAAAGALLRGELADFGRQVSRSQQLAQDLLGNQIAETIFLARSALDLEAIAASAFGAGFGGGVWSLVQADQAESFLRDWRKLYCERFPQHSASSHFFLTPPAPAAFQL